MEWVLPNHSSGHMKERQVIGISQPGFTKAQSCLTDLTAFCDKMSGFADEGTAAVISLDFHKDFSAVFHHTCVQVRMAWSEWVNNWKNGWLKQLVEWWGSDLAGETTGLSWDQPGLDKTYGLPSPQKARRVVQQAASKAMQLLFSEGFGPGWTKPQATCSEHEDRPETPGSPSRCKISIILGIV